MPIGPGVTLHNRYRVVRLLGQGGFGAVYRAWDLTLQRPCAIKENLETATAYKEQFLREARMLSNLTHSNLPRVTDYFAIPNQGQYLVMDFIDGQDLQDMLDEAGKPLPETQALAWIEQVSDALSYLHSQKPAIIHRDIKPKNIIINSNNKAFLVDFGIAKMFDPNQKTTIGARAVTPGYSPVEQYGHGKTDNRTDVYALGATLYTMLTNQVPVESVNRNGTPLIPPRSINPKISTHTEEVILTAMELSPSHRFQSMEQFQKALKSAQSILKTSAKVVAPQFPPTVAASPPISDPQADNIGAVASSVPPAKGHKLWSMIGIGVGLCMIIAAFLLIIPTAIGNEPLSIIGASLASDTPTATYTQPTKLTLTETSIAPDISTLTITPGEIDTDNDGLPDSNEVDIGTDPINPSLTATAANYRPTDTPIPPTQVPTNTSYPTIPYDMAFASDRSGNVSVYLMDIENPENWIELPIPSGYNRAWWPNFCKDFIAIEVQDRNGPNPQWIVLIDPRNGTNITWQPSINRQALGVPRCSPDGHTIAYSYKDDNWWGAMAIDDFPVSGSQPIFQQNSWGYSSWTRNLNFIYTMTKDNRKWVIQSNNMSTSGTGSSPTIIASGKYPAISPDGDYLVYICHGNNDLCIMDLSSKQTNTLADIIYINVNGEKFPASAMWSKDGSWIYFSSAEDGDWDIYRIHPDGSGLQNLTSNWTSNELMPALQW